MISASQTCVLSRLTIHVSKVHGRVDGPQDLGVVKIASIQMEALICHDDVLNRCSTAV